MEYFELRQRAEDKAKSLGLYTTDTKQNAVLDELLASLCYDFELYFRELLTDTEFHQGARAMFDFFLDKAANNWHGNPKINEQCEHESVIATSWAKEAFSQVSPSDYNLWVEITTLQSRIKELESQLRSARNA